MSASVDVKGMKALQRNLKALPVGLQRKYNKQAVRKAGGLIAKDARKRVKGPTKKQRQRAAEEGRREPRTGLLGKSIAVKVVGKSGQPHAGAVIGPRTNVQGVGYYARLHIPSKVAHLVEGGHKGPKPAPPHPFMRPAYDAQKGPSQRVIAETLWAGLKKEAEKP